MLYLLFSCQVGSNCLRPHGLMPGLNVLHYLAEFAQIHIHWIGDSIKPSHPLSPSCFAFNLSQHQGLFQWVALHIRGPKYWSFSYSMSFFDEYSGLISFWTDWFESHDIICLPTISKVQYCRIRQELICYIFVLIPKKKVFYIPLLANRYCKLMKLVYLGYITLKSKEIID